ncbi:MAG: biopolymer transporter ExbD [Leptospiraceae bacterium]|nr:biopolymer transporter ExbD [Leptospiraceae bacterium]
MNPFPGGGESEGGELPLAPFLDIIFILLIFVLVSTRMVDERLLPVDLPSSESGQESVDDRKVILIYLEAEKARIPSLDLDMELAGIRAGLQEVCTENPMFKIRASRDVPLQSFVELTDSLRGCGSVQLMVRRP